MPLLPSNYNGRLPKITNYNSYDDDLNEDLPYHHTNHRNYPTNPYNSNSTIPNNNYSSYTSLNPSYTPSNPSYTPLNSSYTSLNPSHSSFNSSHSSLNPSYTSLNPSYSSLNPSYTSLNPSHSSLNPSYSSLTPSYSSLNPSYTPLNSSYSATRLNNSTPLDRLPPQAPSSSSSLLSASRRYTPLKRSYVDEDYSDRMPTQRPPIVFQSRPLKNLTVLSQNERGTPIIRSVTRSPSPSLSVNRSYENGNKSDYADKTKQNGQKELSMDRLERDSSLTRDNLPIKTRSITPRRIYPQEAVKIDLDELSNKEEAPVVFDANLTFVLGTKGKMKQQFTPLPAHMEDSTASSCLTTKIADFLKRTDHVMDEWKSIGRKKGKSDYYDNNNSRSSSRRSLGRSRSSTNIMIKGFQLYSRASSCRSSMVRDISEDRTEADGEELSEMTTDLAEEQSTSTLATEKFDVEAAERLRIQRELTDVQEKNKTLKKNSERLELELMSVKSDLNSINENDVVVDDDVEINGGECDGVYKRRYERATKELEFTKKRLQQQHEDDLEQLIALKKQLEKKLTDAYEEVEEQRQVVSQWKRKVQKLNGEMNDLKLLLEEQNSRNNLLEKKQRKFDSEMQLLNDELKQERLQKERSLREKDVILAEKFTLDSHLADVRLELELKDEKLIALQTDYDELTYGGKTEEEVTILRRQKIDCERRLHDQNEELDDLIGQVQLLEQAKLKLEMALEHQRKSGKKEAQQHEEELEEIRSNAQKKIKSFEAQLENEHEERTLLVREKHELERRLIEIMETDRNEKACDEALFHRLKRDLKRTKALLKDTQTQLERVTNENPNKSVIRQLKNQLEDLECARNVALKTKQSLEIELLETQNQLEDVIKQKNETEEKANIINREKSELQVQLEENEEELAELLKKYKTAVQQMSMDQAALQEQVCLVSELEVERNKLREQLNELSMKLENAENVGGASSNVILKRGELKLKELESKLELEQTTRTRLEVQITRLKDAVEKLQIDVNNSRIKEHSAQDLIRKLQRTLREVKEELNNSAVKENEAIQKRKEIEKKYEGLENETVTLRQDLKMALKRITDLQVAIQGELDDSNSDHSDSEKENYSSDESVNTFLLNHKGPSTNTNKSISDSGRRSSNTSRSSTSSFLG